MPGIYNFRDDGTDRIYNLNRVMMAAALADGKSTSAVKGAHESSWNNKYNTAMQCPSIIPGSRCIRGAAC